MKPSDPAYKNLSCQYITEALFRLMAKENYNDITISEITAEAGIARRTFYLNYTSKEDILDRHYETLIREYDAGLDEAVLGSMASQAVYFFSFWKKHRDYAQLLDKNGLFHMLVNRFHLYLDRTEIPYIPGRSPAAAEYTFAYLAGGLWMMLQTWMGRDFRESPEQLAETFSAISALPA